MNKSNHKKCKYKITSGLTGLILSLLLLLVFGGLTYWFYITQNGAIIIGRILVIFAALAFVLALYRALFFKVLIYKDGFFYQTAPNNGKYYTYSEIRKVWVSSGRETNAREMTYCNFETIDGKIFRFYFIGVNIDAVDYLIKQAESVETIDNNRLKDDDREHIISGKVQGLHRIVIVIFIFAIILMMTKTLATEGLPPLTYMLPIVLTVVSIALVMNYYFFYKILIQKDGFYFRTNPFNGKYFKYRDIVDCKLIEKRKKTGSVRRGTREIRYFYFLIFTDATNKKHKILYDKTLFEREMNILVSRIRQALEKSENNEAK